MKNACIFLLALSIIVLTVVGIATFGGERTDDYPLVSVGGHTLLSGGYYE